MTDERILKFLKEEGVVFLETRLQESGEWILPESGALESDETHYVHFNTRGNYRVRFKTHPDLSEIGEIPYVCKETGYVKLEVVHPSKLNEGDCPIKGEIVNPGELAMNLKAKKDDYETAALIRNLIR